MCPGASAVWRCGQTCCMTGRPFVGHVDLKRRLHRDAMSPTKVEVKWQNWPLFKFRLTMNLGFLFSMWRVRHWPAYTTLFIWFQKHFHIHVIKSQRFIVFFFLFPYIYIFPNLLCLHLYCKMWAHSHSIIHCCFLNVLQIASFQIKWSDSSLSHVTKTHLELENFLLKVSTVHIIAKCNEQHGKTDWHI